MSKTVGMERANILIVDDVPANLMILSDMIKDLGYIPHPVISVKKAQEAVEKIAKSYFAGYFYARHYRF